MASPIDAIIGMLASDAQEKRLAAAVVLGELKVETPRAVKALSRCLADAGPPLQRACLDALAAAGASRAVDAIVPLCGARDAAVRGAATLALASVGESIVPRIERELSLARDSEARRALDEVLARIGGKQALGALLGSLEGADEAAAARAAVAMRERVKGADKRQRSSYLAQLEDLLARQKRKPHADRSQAAVRAAIKMLGYLEDERAVATLLEWSAANQPASIRQEALIALRFSAKDGKNARLVGALVKAAQDADRALGQTALITLSGLPLPPRAAEQLEPLLAHPDLERARFVVDLLARRPGADAAAALVGVLAAQEPRRAELAARALSERKDSAGMIAPLLVEALLATADRDRARLIVRVLDPVAQALTPAQKKALLTGAVERLADGDAGWQPLFDAAHAGDPVAAGDALRELARRLSKNQPDRAREILRQLCRTDQATREDRFALAVALLAASPKDTSQAARNGDEALGILGRLLRESFDLAGALLADKSCDLDTLYYVGFHFLEQHHSAGEDLLAAVAERGGRKKIAAMARNKLKLAS